MTVVSDASPILNLFAIRRLSLLKELYGNVLVPSAVGEELERNSVKVDPAWISIRTPRDIVAVRSLRGQLDAGESETIVLAEEYSAELVLIDERRGWKIATGRSLTCIGLLGVLAEAKRRGAIKACQPILDAMIREAGFWVGEALRKRFLSGVNESSERVELTPS